MGQVAASMNWRGGEERGVGEVLRPVAPAERPAPPVTAAAELPDEALLERIAQGDSAAFRQFHRRHKGRVERFLHSVLRRHDLVDEVTNDVMLVVWRNAGNFRGESRVTTWMLGIAFRTATKALRRWRLDREAVELELLELVDPRSTLEAQTEAHARLQLTEAIAALPAPLRLVLELAYLHGHSCTEIATITGSPVGTVKTRLLTARNRLRARFGSDSETGSEAADASLGTTP